MTDSSDGIRIVSIGPDSSDGVVAALAGLHAAEIEAGFLASLGEDLLVSLYRELADSPLSSVFGAVTEDGRIVGLICGTTSSRAVLARYFRGRAWRILPFVALKLLSPERLFRAVESVFYSLRCSRPELPKPEILNFCVDRGHQGRQVGRRLFAALIDDFRSRGVSAVRIVTGANQTRAQKFYEYSGARRVGDLSVHRGATSHVYVYEIGTTSFGGAAA